MTATAVSELRRSHRASRGRREPKAGMRPLMIDVTAAVAAKTRLDWCGSIN